MSDIDETVENLKNLKSAKLAHTNIPSPREGYYKAIPMPEKAEYAIDAAIQALEQQRVREWPKKTSAMERAGVHALLNSNATCDQQLVWEIFGGMLAAAPTPEDSDQ